LKRIAPWLLLLLFACGEDAPPPAPVLPAPVLPQPATAPATPSDLLAVRSYEILTNGRRAGVLRVTWRRVAEDGGDLVEDVTESNTRTVRMMGPVPDVFTSRTITRTLREATGELRSMDSATELPGRTDGTKIERTETGYRVTVRAGPNEESFDVAAEHPAMVDAEAFLGSRIAAGEAQAGSTWTLPLLDAGRRRIVEATLKVVGPDVEGPGLKVVETLDGQDTLWWFDTEGAVVRQRAGNTVIRRDDALGLEDLPARPASWQITLPSDVDLPRIFTGKTMEVEILVETDETTRAPHIPASPFTEVVSRTDERVVARLKSHDDPEATTKLPIDPRGFEEYLKATPLMEVDDPEVRRVAREVVGDETDARAAARRIADFVFRHLGKGSPALPDPSVKQILRDGEGDCSEHALLFTGLCRAAGIPARRCSGYVCIGEDWGGHGWCEIWLGKWIGADPTTNEIGTRARYILLSRPDDPETTPARIIAERTRIRILKVEYEDGTLDPHDPDADPAVFSGLRLQDPPPAWKIDASRYELGIEAEGWSARARLGPDHGYRALDILSSLRLPGGRRGTFGSREGVYLGRRGQTLWIVPLGRELLYLRLQGPVPTDTLARALAPTLGRNG